MSLKTISMKNIRSLYAQKGHLFYRDRLTFSQHSAQSFYYVKNFQNHFLHNKEHSLLLLASTFHNIGKMIDKNSNSRFSSGFLHIKSFPLPVCQTVYLTDMAKRYLITDDKNLLIKSPYIHRELVNLGWTLNQGEISHFKMEKYYPISLCVAENDICGLKNKIHDLTDANWLELEAAVENVFQS